LLLERPPVASGVACRQRERFESVQPLMTSYCRTLSDFKKVVGGGGGRRCAGGSMLGHHVHAA
jgi:hypothetical protein